MQKQYILNRETGKIELHFEKSEYEAMPEGQKEELKRHFLWKGSAKAWVSRSKEPNLHWAIQTALKLGFTNGGKTGERLAFAEKMARKSERAEERAERFEEYADNAARRGESLQAEFNKFRGDIAWLTQSIMAGHAGSQAFGRQRQRIVNRYEKGFEEYRKSEYFRKRAATARATAEHKLTDRFYLNNRINECEREIKTLSARAATYEDILYKVEKGQEDQLSGKYTQINLNLWLTDILESLDAEIDKLAYFKNALDEIGGIAFSQENIKPGYIIKIRGGNCQVIKANPKTLQIRIMSGGAAGMVLTHEYSEVQAIVKAEEVKRRQETEPHPYQVGEILVAHRAAGTGSIYRAYQVIARTDKTIQIQQIQVKEGKPIPGDFVPGSKLERKKPTVRSYTNQWAVYDSNEWQLTKFSVTTDVEAC